MKSIPPDVIQKLHRAIDGEVKFDPTTRILYSTDASIHKIEPLGAVFPRNYDDLKAIVSIASEYKVPLVARGAGSSLAGQSIGPGLIVDCSRYLSKFIEVNIEEQTAIVDPGIVLDDINRNVKKFNLQFGPDPASSERATIGGCIGNNATGAHSIIYGMTSDHIISTDVILSDGRQATFQTIQLIDVDNIVNSEALNTSITEKKIYQSALKIRENYADEIKRCFPSGWRRVSGYNLNYLLSWSETHPAQWTSQLPYPPVVPGTINLAQLIAGSEGTLGIIERAKIRLVPIKKHSILAVLNFSSIYDACSAVPDILEHKPSAVELIPRSLIHLARSVPAYANQLSFVVGDPDAMLIVEFKGDISSELDDKVDKLKSSIRWGIDPLIARTAIQQKEVWDVRKVGLGILMSRLGDVKPHSFIEDMAVPVEKLADFIRELDKILSDHQTYADYYGHASVGCLHIRPLINLKTETGRGQLRSIAQASVDLVLKLGGVVSAEHGDGITRGEWIERAYGPKLMEAFRSLKDAADPDRIFNPGKIVDTPPMDRFLRYDSQYQATGWLPVMVFSSAKPDPKNVAEAIEQCNGVGVCRKSSGVMCPSFQASQDEYLSTRGRANLLRAMVSHVFDSDEDAFKAVKGTLEKCLACKGCKAECPSAVDIAKLKYEFYQYYYSLPGHNRPVRDYVFANIDKISKYGYRFAPIINYLLSAKIYRGARQKIFGLSKYRNFPKLSGTTLHRESKALLRNDTDPTCILLSDAFNEFYYPEVGLETIRVLLYYGCRVKLLSTLGSGRTLISKGFLKQAKKHAKKLVDEINRIDPSGKLPIIGIEPSEIYTLKEEYQDFFPLDDYVKSFIARAYMIDEYLIRIDAIQGDRINNSLSNNTIEINRTNVLLHGHCYQKAQPLATDGKPIGVLSSKALLEAYGYGVKIIDDGCCGMAGAFGYEAENYDLSIKVGQLALYPAIENTDEVLIAAAGISCRSQIEDGTSRKAAHPISLVAERLFSGGT